MYIKLYFISDRMAQDFDIELQGTGVHAVAIWPGPVRTELVNEHIRDADKSAATEIVKAKEMFKRGQTPDWVGKTVAQLLLDKNVQDKAGRVVWCHDIADEFNIPYINSIWNKDDYSRDEYEILIYEKLKTYSPDLVVFAGWDFIVNKIFLSSFKKVINLHPSLPNTFVGQNCIKKAYNAFQKGEIKYTGSMVHEVVLEVDKGNVLTYIKVPIFNDDTYETLEYRVKDSEKGILIQSIQIFINTYNEKIICSLLT